MNSTVYDLAIVGSGIACSMSLCHLGERLKKSPSLGRILRIAVIEKEGELWNGIPYGRRSTASALTFQRLHEFLKEPERASFIHWLITHKELWSKSFLERGGAGAVRWMTDNQTLIDNGQWDELYLPRFLFGLYVSSQTTKVIQDLSKARLASLTFIHGEAVGMSRMPGMLHNILVRENVGLQLSVRAARVVIAIGSPPHRNMYNSEVGDQDGHLHINNIYSPCEEATMQKITQALCGIERASANLLVVGSNASALEVLYLARHRADLRDLIGSVVVLSHSGTLPYKISGGTLAFELSALKALQNATNYTAADLMNAITADISRAHEQELNIADLRDPVGAKVSALLGRLPETEQERFVCQYGIHYSRKMRRAGRDTRTAADELMSLGMLTMVQGDLQRLQSGPDKGTVTASYAPGEGQPEVLYPKSFRVTINCGGFEELDSCSSPFINSLMNNGICSPNSTRRGFLLNERLEASENVYVIGPLVAGNYNDKVRFWHVESAATISDLAKQLAETLAESLTSLAGKPLSQVSVFPESAAVQGGSVMPAVPL